MNFILDEKAGLSKEPCKPYLTALVNENKRDIYDDEYRSFRILKVLESDKEQAMMLGCMPEFGDYHSVNDECATTIKESENFSLEEMEEAKKLDREFDEYHKSAPYYVNGLFFDEKPGYSSWDTEKRYPRYELLDEARFKCPAYVNSLDKAELWLLNNHPDFHMGCGIHQDCRGGDFMMSAVPCNEYALYKTWEDRRLNAESRLEELFSRLSEDEKAHFSDKLGPIEHGFMGKRKEDAMLEKDTQPSSDPEYKEKAKEHSLEDVIPGEKKPEQHLDKNYMIIWQRDDAHTFVDLKCLKDRGIEPKRSDYTAVYIGPKVSSFDEAYTKFQNTEDTPDDYMARSLSVGDIVTINDNGKDRSSYVESIGFTPLDDFTKDMYLVNGIIHDKTQMTAAEVEKFENIYQKDIDNSKTIGSENIAEDVRDRDLNANGYADKYDEEYDEELVR
ncbi:MAG: hypothetical protein K6G10_07070, partial [Butyrivibrio sp.]|nr:hypothetical protein [Butyrivibrio sp.]